MNLNQTERPDRSSEFDPRRSNEIRSLLTSVVAGAPRPRTPRLSRAAFSLAATAALLFAGGIGAGTVLAYDQISESGDPENAAVSGIPASAAEPLSASSGDDYAGDLRPILIMNGEVGYAYQGALAAADTFATAYTPKSDTTGTKISAPLVPVYLADGVTLVGYYDPASLIPK
ncbi:hypothetical protein [Cryobacterium sp. TMT4-31]|uniref:hypothetical protein n=1 Tax=Cryobacterium sp. TMT4-31 TaxID=1259259 RepID=UPI001069443C|nr:hypothetical protein [Cryobacterium sp. TMT4-31]TFC87413.1 hypothetical protein E3T19_12305 [Cryobacterium sp. TMT4-31]